MYLGRYSLFSARLLYLSRWARHLLLPAPALPLPRHGPLAQLQSRPLAVGSEIQTTLSPFKSTWRQQRRQISLQAAATAAKPAHKRRPGLQALLADGGT